MALVSGPQAAPFCSATVAGRLPRLRLDSSQGPSPGRSGPIARRGPSNAPGRQAPRSCAQRGPLPGRFRAGRPRQGPVPARRTRGPHPTRQRIRGHGAASSGPLSQAPRGPTLRPPPPVGPRGLQGPWAVPPHPPVACLGVRSGPVRYLIRQRSSSKVLLLGSHLGHAPRVLNLKGDIHGYSTKFQS
ncbi:hypothetical protein NDU88_001584 [Pleurodeles waltl]|uniref:Uncharacterized protein n=1 Tax=Pleurodeles waltl TaxID=8319 RepID=A0AAV7U8U8_PLEWA|nr:hypothetical protein NDU88_001584 [Pleurodeles waltl]